MQEYVKSIWIRWKPYLVLAAIVLIAYLPVSSMLFALKNDAYTGYFPPKFILSEIVWAKQAPWWNPYINFGYPFYGDMSAAFWSPFTWLVIALGGYNAYSFTFEVLGYLILASWGFYRLGARWQWAQGVRMALAVSYACSGYMVGHLQHVNWISGAALLPWVCLAYLRLWDNQPPLKSGAHLGFWVFLLVSTAHPGISIGAVYFLLVLTVALIGSNTTRARKMVVHLAQAHGWSILAFVVFGAGMLAGYADILPWFERGEKLTLARALEHPSGPSTWISFLAPLVTVRADAWMLTDISMRNWFMGVLPLLTIIPLQSLPQKKRAWGWILIGFLFAALSAGGWFKALAYYTLPGIGFVRLNGEFRIFSILAWLIAAGFSLQFLWTNWEKVQVQVVRRLNWISSIVFLFVLVGLFQWWPLDHAVEGNPSINPNDVTITGRIKQWIDALTLADAWLIQAIITAFAVITIGWALQQKKTKWMLFLVIGQAILFNWLLLPFTGVGKMSTPAIQAWVDKSPAGIPIPSSTVSAANKAPEGWPAATLGHWSMYSKAIGPLEEVPYPITLHAGRTYFDSADRLVSAESPWIKFVQSSTQQDQRIALVRYSPTEIQLQWPESISGELQIHQIWHPGWQSEQQAWKSQSGLLTTDLKSAKTIAARFTPPFSVYVGMFLSVASLIAFLLSIVFKRK